MQPDTQDDLAPEGGGRQAMIDGQTAQISTGFGNQVIMLQPPSSAAKVIGILLIIWGAINSVFLLLAMLGWSDSTIREEQGIDGLSIALNVVSGSISIGTSLIGGIWMMNYQRRGVYLVLIGIVIGFLFSIVLSFTGSTDVAAQDTGLNESVVSSIAVGISAVCSAVCGLIVAIPLMISNNGLDDSKLFG
ncbi:MAG: hypothetical protein VXY53_03975 [Candidatus Thermoplasmatota archaeon]|nr:hypothetical protein [Candidatus Thermoplasmatota archaeon]